MHTLLFTIRLAVRRLIRRKMVSAVILFCLALGIGANTAIFSVVNALLVRPLPVEDVDRVVFTLDMRTEDDPFEASALDANAFRTQARSFSDIGLGMYQDFSLRGVDRPERLSGAAISSDYLTVLRTKPILGRGFLPEDDKPGAAPVTLLSHSLWQSRFAGDRNILGHNLTMGKIDYTIVGVLPEGFDLPIGTQVWVPLALNMEALPIKEQVAHRYFLIARLKPGVSIEDANREVKNLAQDLERQYPEHRKGWGLKVIPLRQQLLGDITGTIRPTLLLVMGVVGFLLLITCTNIATLLLSRSLERKYETAIQLALGANRKRLILQMLTEGILLSLLGGALGLVFARFVTSSLMTLQPVYFVAMKDALQQVPISGSVLAFTFGVSLVTGIIFVLAPAALMFTSTNLVADLGEGGQRGGMGKKGRRSFDFLFVSEIAIATVLLFGAIMMVKSFQRLNDAKLGFRSDNLLSMELYMSDADYTQFSQRTEFVKRLLDKVASVPGVVSAGTTTDIPIGIASLDATYTVEGKPLNNASEIPITAHRLVSPGYMETLGVTLLEGRLIEEQDRADTLPVVVISKEFANREWPGESPLGKRVRPGHPPAPTTPWYTVVGVVDNVKEDRFNFRVDRPVWYLPYVQVENTRAVALLVHTSTPPLNLVEPIRGVIESLNKNQSVSDITTMDRMLSEFIGPQRFAALLTSLFAGLGLFQAALGIYGVTAFSVTQRTREFCIRLAFGARWADLVRLVVTRGTLLAVVGLIIGSAGGLALGRVLSNLLYQVKPTAPEILLVPAGILLLVVLAATYLPMLRLLRLDPARGLRHE